MAAAPGSPDPRELEALAARLGPGFLAAAAPLGLDPAQAARALLDVYLPLAAWIAARRGPGAFVLGINGAQGSGKSTLAALLARVLGEGFGWRVAVLSLDDLYRTRAEREALAQDVHPLLRTRGVPGTHDVALGLRVLDALKGGESLDLPSFDKAADDRRPVVDWPRFEGPADVVLFEGWCVGAHPQSEADLAAPVNDLEALEDADGPWRRHVNDQLTGAYADLWARLDALVFLQVPSFDHVLAWRGLQEQRLAAAGAPPERLMDAAALRRFVQHYERLTRAMLLDLPQRADLVLSVGEDHQVVEVRPR